MHWIVILNCFPFVRCDVVWNERRLYWTSVYNTQSRYAHNISESKHKHKHNRSQLTVNHKNMFSRVKCWPDAVTLECADCNNIVKHNFITISNSIPTYERVRFGINICTFILGKISTIFPGCRCNYEYIFIRTRLINVIWADTGRGDKISQQFRVITYYSKLIIECITLQKVLFVNAKYLFANHNNASLH